MRRLAGLLRNLPLDGTAVWREARRHKPTGAAKAVDPPDEWWTPERDLLASILDALRVLIWQPTEDGRHGRNAPQPTRRPGVAKQPQQRSGDPAERVRRLRAMAGRSGGGDPGVGHHDEPAAAYQPEEQSPQG